MGSATPDRRRSVPWPVLRSRPGKLDPFEVMRAWLGLAMAEVAKAQYRRSPGCGGVRTGTLERSPEMLWALAGQFQADERTVESAILRALSMTEDYGQEVQVAVWTMAMGPGTPAGKVYRRWAQAKLTPGRCKNSRDFLQHAPLVHS